MSYEYRDAINAFQGTLSLDRAVSDTTLVSAAFASLPSDYSTATPGKYLPLELNNYSTGDSEVVWVNSHTAGSTSVGALRGQEGTTALAWPAGTPVACAPTAKRDNVLVTTTGALPSNQHIGLETVLTDKGGDLRKRVANGLLAAVGAGIAGNFGTNMASVSPPDGVALDFRAGRFAGSTNSSGAVSASYKTAFPNSTLGVWFTSVDLANGKGPFILNSTSASGFNVICYNLATLAASVSLSFMYIALGW